MAEIAYRAGRKNEHYVFIAQWHAGMLDRIVDEIRPMLSIQSYLMAIIFICHDASRNKLPLCAWRIT